ncbi:MAG: sarcosine oxidase subunit gamma family protein [Burkholderiaceae bacterium]
MATGERTLTTPNVADSGSDSITGASTGNGRKATTHANAGEHAHPGSIDTPGLHAQWRHALTLFSLRGDADDPRFRDALADAGIPLPAQANTTLVHDRLRIVWAGPDDWLILAGSASRDGLAARLHGGLRDLHHALTDISDGFALLSLSGEQARDVLAHGCPLDLHPREFHAGMCAGSHYFKAQIRLWRADEEQGWQMLVRRSFVGYVDLLLRRSIAL